MTKQLDKLVVSFPRSGLNWLRYCTEFLTKKPTPGVHRRIPGVNEQAPASTFDRTHFVQPGISFAYSKLPRPLGQYRKVLLILRNYKENFIRSRLDAPFKKQPLLRLEGYANNVVEFDRLKCEKHVVYYEDVIHNFDYMIEALQFLEVPMTHLQELTHDLEHHKAQSIATYSNKSYTGGNPKKLLFHSKEMPLDARLLIDGIIREKTGAAFDRYLQRYADSGDVNLKLELTDPDLRLLVEQHGVQTVA